MSLGLAMGSEENEGVELLGVQPLESGIPIVRIHTSESPECLRTSPNMSATLDFKLKGPERTRGIPRIARV